MKGWFLGVLAGLLLAACGNNNTASDRKNGFSSELKTREDSLVSAVMEGHDVGMARMIRISRYLTQIAAAEDSLSKLPAAGKNTAFATALAALKSELQEAESGMNQWMEAYVPDSASSDKTKRLEYLESEKQKVEKVRDNIISSLSRADSLFGRK